MGARWIGKARFRMSWLSAPSFVLMTTTYLLGSVIASPAPGDASVTSALVTKLSMNADRMNFPATGAVESHVVEDDHAEVGVELDLSLELALHGPVERLVKDVSLRRRNLGQTR